jgi:UDP-N-acetyl-D-glucosamine/UDP-N-acetyl-D-galactosamine dehydrogenase
MIVINKNTKIAVVGLGYVGLPLLLEISKKFKTIGFDKSNKKISDLKKQIDYTSELSEEQIKYLKKIKITSNLNDLSEAQIFIVAVPTPIDKRKKPDLSILKDATKNIAQILNKKSIVIYESTVYPGVTENFCVPIIEKYSGLKWKKDFFVGYTPERINPGDKKHTLKKIIKVVSGDTKKTLQLIHDLYAKIIKAGIFKAQSIQVAEAAKVIENTQRDLNIALMNELSIIFKKMNIDINKVLEAANTKWNFNLYYPGFVGGHCIGVDPYYLTYKAKQLNYNPKVILAGRAINDQMANYASKEILKILIEKRIKKKSNILILGYTFKENCPDYRNTQIKKIKDSIQTNYKNTEIFDPYIREKISKKFLIDLPKKKNFYDVIIIAVPHKYFLDQKNNIKRIGKKGCLFFDLKNCFKNIENQWRL